MTPRAQTCNEGPNPTHPVCIYDIISPSVHIVFDIGVIGIGLILRFVEGISSTSLQALAWAIPSLVSSCILRPVSWAVLWTVLRAILWTILWTISQIVSWTVSCATDCATSRRPFCTACLAEFVVHTCAIRSATAWGIIQCSKGEEELDAEEWELDLLLEADDKDPTVIAREDNEICGWEELRV